MLTLTALIAAGCSGGGSSEASSSGTVSTTAASSSTTAVPATTAAVTTTTAAETTTPAATTIDELLALGRPLVLAHTAGEDELPASTLFAFAESVAAGVDVLDLNVNLTADDVLVVQHDDTVDRNTDGAGAVADLTMAQIAEFDAAYWFSAACADCRDLLEADYLYRGIRTGDRPAPAGYTAADFALPSLRQLVERFPTMPLNIEIKGEGEIGRRSADVLAALLVELGKTEDSVVASFSDEVVNYFHEIAPDVEVSAGLDALTAYVLEGTALPEGMRILQLPPEFQGIKVITPELLARAAADGLPIWIWPNNRDLENLESYRGFLEQGIAGLNINFPAQGVQAVREFIG